MAIQNLTVIYTGADLSGAAADVIYLPILEDGTLKAVDVLTDETVAADVVFSLKKNGVVQASAAVTITTGSKIGSVSGLTINVVKGDEIVLRRVSGAISSPVTLNLSVDDGKTADDLTEGATNKYFTNARVLATALLGYVVGSNAAIAGGDTILQAFQKIQAQINAAFSGTGTTNKIAKFTGASAVGDSNLSDDGTDITANDKTLSRFSAKINDQTGSTYTLQSSDNGKILTFSNAAAVTVTVPSTLGLGFSCVLYQKGAGQITVAAGSGATLRNPNPTAKTRAQYSTATVFSVVSSEFVLAGDIAQS